MDELGILTQELLKVALVSFVIMGIIDAAIKPIFLKFGFDTWWLFYVGILFGGFTGWATEINAFPWFPEGSLIIGRVITAVVCGIGPSFIYNLIDKGQEARLPE